MTKRVSILSASLLFVIAPVCAQTRTQPGICADENAAPRPAAVHLSISLDTRMWPRFAEENSRQETSWVSGAETHFLTMETPFVSDVTFQVASLARGHVELGGFHRMSADENFYLGLPGSGGLPAWAVTLASHPALWSRAATESGGLTLAFHPHASRGPEPEPAVQVLRKLSRLAESAYRN